MKIVTRLLALTALITSGAALAALPSADAARGDKINAVVASFDAHAAGPQRFIVGLVANDNRTLAYGTVKFRFGYAGTADNPERKVTTGSPYTAQYLAIPGGTEPARSETARLVAPSVSRGVYAAEDATFDRPGLWVVLVIGTDRGRRFTTNAAFEVPEHPQVAAIGDPAPRSQNPLPGTAGIDPKAIDSRATKTVVPDPELHTITVADAVVSAKPTMIVVSTPVYCVSQFCGPITDRIQALARQHGAQMNFVHLEVWADFQNKKLNDAASQWIVRRDNGDANEPWVFVIDRNGTIVERFDNVASDQELQDAVNQQLQ